MLPSAEPEATVVVCEDDPPTLDLLCDHLHADRFEALAGALRGRRASPLPLQRPRPPAARPPPARRFRARRAPRDPRLRRADGPLRPRAPGDRPVSGRSTDVDRVRGFREGADDYVVKPFHYQEVAARIRAVAAPPRRAPRGAAADRRPVHRPLAARGPGRRPRGRTSRTRSSRCCARSPPSRTACSPRRSSCATSGAFGRWGGPGRWTRTPAGCGESSIPRPAATSSTAGASATGCSSGESRAMTDRRSRRLACWPVGADRSRPRSPPAGASASPAAAAASTARCTSCAARCRRSSSPPDGAQGPGVARAPRRDLPRSATSIGRSTAARAGSSRGRWTAGRSSSRRSSAGAASPRPRAASLVLRWRAGSAVGPGRSRPGRPGARQPDRQRARATAASGSHVDAELCAAGVRITVAGQRRVGAPAPPAA